MELQPGLFVHNAAAMRVALEQMRTTLSQEDWTLLRQEMRRIWVLLPKQTKNKKEKYIPKTIQEVFQIQKQVKVDCPICCDHHHKTDCVTTSCGHCFGKDCFHLWAETQQSKQTVVTCPMCVAVVEYLV
jgi:hypothetical protein